MKNEGGQVEGALGRRIMAIVALSAGNCIASVDATILNVALPTISHDLGVPTSSAVLLVTAYQLVLLMTLLPFAALGEKFGLTRVYQFGQALFAISSLGCFIADSLPMLLAARICQSLGSSALLAVAPALIRHAYPPERLGRGLALNAFIVTMASSLAPTLGGAVMAIANWRWVFAIVLPLILISLALGRALPPNTTHDEPYDFRAALMSAGMFFLIISGIETAIQGGSLAIVGGLVAAGIALGYVFLRREKLSSRPVFPVDLLARPPIALSTAGLFALYIASQMILLIMPFKLQHGYGFTPAEVGATIGAWSLAMVVAIPLAGYLSDRFTAGALGATGMIFTFAGMMSLAFLPMHAGPFDVAWRLWLCGAGNGLYLAPLGRFVLAEAPRERMAAAGGLNGTSRLLGQTLGASLSALLLATGLGLGRVPPLIAAGAAILACGFALTRVRPSRQPTHQELEEATAPLADGSAP